MTTLKGFNSVFEQTLSNDIQDSLVSFFDWGLLQKGNYFNVTLGESSPSGTDMSSLRPVDHPSVPDGKVWEGFRKNWVWQSGISVNGQDSPLVGTNNAQPGISGVYVNDTFYPSTTSGTYAHYVDYHNGRIVFDSPISTGDVVQAEFSYKWINVVGAEEVPWLQKLQTRTNYPTASFSDQDKGSWNPPARARLQLPLIAVETVTDRGFKPYQIGGGQWVYTDVVFHCIAEDGPTLKTLMDITSLQNDKSIDIFDSNAINAASGFPIDYRGTPVSGALTYPELVNTYGGGRIRLGDTNAKVGDTTRVSIEYGTVRTTTEGIKTNI